MLWPGPLSENVGQIEYDDDRDRNADQPGANAFHGFSPSYVVLKEERLRVDRGSIDAELAAGKAGLNGERLRRKNFLAILAKLGLPVSATLGAALSVNRCDRF
ncbi:MAG: hypothetical protein WAT09_09285 [Paracoccaceae bacterium]